MARKSRKKFAEDSDTDFQPEDRQESPDVEEEDGPVDLAEIAPEKPPNVHLLASKKPHPALKAPKTEAPPKPSKPFKRAQVLPARLPPGPADSRIAHGPVVPDPFDGLNRAPPPPFRPSTSKPSPPIVVCPACGKSHSEGSCPLKLAGVEHCNLCGLAHYGIARTCPHIGSETQVILMIDALKNSREPLHLKEQALKYLRGVKGTLVQQKKRVRERAADTEGQIPGHNQKTNVERAGKPGRTSTPGEQNVLQPTSGNSNVSSEPAPNGARMNGIASTGPSNQTHRAEDVEDRLFAALGPSG